MALILSGSDGLSDVDGSASTPAIRGTDTNTGIFFPAADTIAFAEGGAEVARFDSSGNMLVGTSSAFYSTSGRGLIEVNGSSTALYGLKVNNAATGYLACSASVVELATNGAVPLLFTTNGAERMRINSAGNVLAATTSAFSDAHTFRSINSSINTFALAVQHTASNADVRGLVINSPNYTGSDGYSLIVNTTGSDRLYIRTSGNIQNQNNSYGGISDVKFKENIEDATPKLDKLLQVKIRSYNLKETPEHKQIGVIAQELEEVFPNLIEESKAPDGLETIKTVKYSVFVPMLIKAIQEQQAIITDLKSRIETLEAK
jgi:hypothetical protein